MRNEKLKFKNVTMLPSKNINKESLMVFLHELAVEPHSHSVPNLARKAAIGIWVSVSWSKAKSFRANRSRSVIILPTLRFSKAYN